MIGRALRSRGSQELERLLTRSRILIRNGHEHLPELCRATGAMAVEAEPELVTEKGLELIPMLQDEPEEGKIRTKEVSDRHGDSLVLAPVVRSIEDNVRDSKRKRGSECCLT